MADTGLELAGLLGQELARHGERTALVDGSTGQAWSYRAAERMAARIQAGLAERGLSAGDHLLIRSWACMPAVLCCWAAWRMGAVPVPVDPSWPPFLLDPVRTQVAPRLELGQEGTPAPGHGALLLADAQGQPSARVQAWLRLEREPAATVLPVADAAPGAVLWTSGSSGRPKGVVLSRGALARSARQVVATFGWRADDRFLNLGEPHAMSGLRNTCLAPVACGAAVVLVPPAARAHAFGVQDCLERHRITGLGAGPGLVRLVLKLGVRLRPAPWAGLDWLLCTGGALAPADAAAFRAWSGQPVINYYGLTETTGLCIAQTPRSARDGDDTLGWPTGAQCRILDPEGGTCPPGTAGELVIQGPNLMLGYLGQPEWTARVLRGDGFHTGDQARLRADGRVELVGRLGHAIKTVHTDLLFPEEIELALAGHPDLADAAAVGVPGRDGDRLVVFLVPRDPAASPQDLAGALHPFLAARLGPGRLPSAYRCLAQVPRLASGKLDRQTLLQEALHVQP